MVYDNDSSHVERLTLSDAYGQEVACLTLDHLLFFLPIYSENNNNNNHTNMQLF
jgi:hypothetical protein